MLKIDIGRSNRGLLIFIVAALLFAGFAITNTVSFSYLKNTLRQSIIETELPKASNEIYSEIVLDLLPSTVASAMLANDHFIRNWLASDEKDVDTVTQYLAQARDRNNAFTGFLVSAKTQNYYTSQGEIIHEKEDDPNAAWYFRFRDSNKEYELANGLNVDSLQTPTVFINYRIEINNQFAGVIGLGVKLKVIQDTIKRYQHISNRHIYFLNSSGQITSNSLGAELTENMLEKVPGLHEFLNQTEVLTPKVFQYVHAEELRFLSLRYIPELKWWVLIEQQEELTFRKVRDMLYANALIGLLTIVVTLILIAWTINLFHKRLEALAMTDTLTGLYNRHIFENDIKLTLSQRKRASIPVSLAIIDIDNFKLINDKYGHLEGDTVIKTIAQIIKDSTRKSDIVSRWGGEEFVILAHNSDLHNTELLAQKIRKNIESHTGFPSQVTISAGVSEAIDNDNKDSLLNRADTALYRAKNDGKNCVRMFEEPS